MINAGVVQPAIEHRITALLLASLRAPEEIPTDAAATLIAFDMAVAKGRRPQDEVMALVHDRLNAAGGHAHDGERSVVRTALDRRPTQRPRLELGTGMRLKVLDPKEDLVMFLLHQGPDPFRYLLRVAEVRQRLQHPLDWMKIEAISRAKGIWEQVYVALEVLCEELQIEDLSRRRRACEPSYGGICGDPRSGCWATLV